jgi:hypothetical protein
MLGAASLFSTSLMSFAAPGAKAKGASEAANDYGIPQITLI